MGKGFPERYRFGARKTQHCPAFSNAVTFIPVITALLLYVLVALREEIAFRAYPLRAMNKALGPLPALFIIFLVFSLEHILGGMSWLQAFAGAGVGSLLFGIAALATKGLAVPIGIHISWNFGQWALGFKDDTGIYRAIVEKACEREVEQLGLLCYLLVMAVGIIGFYFYWRTQKQKSFR
jgi:hypothetical protein